ncbi:hypothetical protein V6N13_137247 [Hibiscus sabdariffa]
MMNLNFAGRESLVNLKMANLILGLAEKFRMKKKSIGLNLGEVFSAKPLLLKHKVFDHFSNNSNVDQMEAKMETFVWWKKPYCCELVCLLITMHAIKGGWVGKTFALAKFNESGGKKSRVRLSKEERKTMVESFIKKYQESNSGNFPSLNLTHKEVGGSFYTVREIVREIIQENRVLGPAKLTEGEKNTDLFLQQNPPGSVSTAPETLLSVQSNGSSFVPHDYEDAIDESVFSVRSEYKKFHCEQIITGDLIDVTNGSDKAAIVEVQVIEPPESDKSEKEMDASITQVTQITADVVVKLASNRKWEGECESRKW